MSDLISRQAAISIVEFECGEWKGLAQTIVNGIKKLRHAQPERKRGRWLNINESEKWGCSECGRIMWFSPRLGVKPSDYRFCPHCGAKMDEEMEGKSKK